MARDIRLVERRRMDHRFDAMAREGALDHCSLRHRTDDMGVGAGRDVQADRDMAGGMESGSKEPAEPPRGTGEQNAH